MAEQAHTNRSDSQPIESNPERSAETQVGQITPVRATRQLTESAPRRVTQNDLLREQVGELIRSLGEPVHPLHANAVTMLVEMGDPAVPQLIQALSPQRPWLTSYKAAEALGMIGDGRAAGALLEALRHPNSNVRWSAVRALSEVGDARALLELRRVAREDRAKTSWGEAVSEAAEAALDRMQRTSLLLRSADLLKTAISLVFMILSLILAYSVITALRNELDQIGTVSAAVEQPIAAVTVAPEFVAATAAPLPTTQPTQPTAPPQVVTTVIQAGNIRPIPSTADNTPIGQVAAGDQLVVLGSTPDREWFRVQLGEQRDPASNIGENGEGWIRRTLVQPVEADVPVIQTP